MKAVTNSTTATSKKKLIVKKGAKTSVKNQEEPKVEKTKKNLKTKVEEPKAKKAEAKNTSTKESKYKYPSTCSDSLTRKKFRHEARAKDKSFTKALEKIKDKGSKEYKIKLKEYNSFKQETYQ